MHFHYVVPGDDFSCAGSASAEMKKKLKQLGIPFDIIKRTAVAMYEAEINMVVHAGGGEADIDILDDKIVIVMKDHGNGIADIEKAMQEGFSTAPQIVQELGFGAGMGLPNMKRNSDFMTIDSKIGVGTTVTMRIDLSQQESSETDGANGAAATPVLAANSTNAVFAENGATVSKNAENPQGGG